MKAVMFQPKGEKSQVQIIYEAIEATDYGELITYQRFIELTGFPKELIRNAAWGVNKKLLKNRKKYMVNERNIGYRIVEPPEQVKIANFRKTRASRQIKKGLTTILNIDISKLTEEEKQRQAHLLNHLATVHSVVKAKQTKAIIHTEKSLNAQKAALVQLDGLVAEIDALRKRIAE